MPANPAAIERHFTQPPDDDDRVLCPECGGSGEDQNPDPDCHYNPLMEPYTVCVGPCPVCDGNGYISAERAAEDAAEAHGDLLMEMARDAAIEHATGFEE